LFSRETVHTDAGASGAEIFKAYLRENPNERLTKQTSQDIQDRLTKVHRYPLSTTDLKTIDRIYHLIGGDLIPYYRLMTATDQENKERSYLASEEAFQVVRNLHMKNLIVPVVGDFAGNKAFQKIAEYV